MIHTRMLSHGVKGFTVVTVATLCFAAVPVSASGQAKLTKASATAKVTKKVRARSPHASKLVVTCAHRGKAFRCKVGYETTSRACTDKVTVKRRIGRVKVTGFKPRCQPVSGEVPLGPDASTTPPPDTIPEVPAAGGDPGQPQFAAFQDGGVTFSDGVVASVIQTCDSRLYNALGYTVSYRNNTTNVPSYFAFVYYSQNSGQWGNSGWIEGHGGSFLAPQAIQAHGWWYFEIMYARQLSTGWEVRSEQVPTVSWFSNGNSQASVGWCYWE